MRSSRSMRPALRSAAPTVLLPGAGVGLENIDMMIVKNSNQAVCEGLNRGRVKG